MTISKELLDELLKGVDGHKLEAGPETGSLPLPLEGFILHSGMEPSEERGS